MKLSRKDIERYYHSPFMKFYGWIGKFHNWVMMSEKRQKWIRRLLIVFIIFEYQVHRFGTAHLSELEHWYDGIPFMETIISIIKTFT